MPPSKRAAKEEIPQALYPDLPVVPYEDFSAVMQQLRPWAMEHGLSPRKFSAMFAHFIVLYNAELKCGGSTPLTRHAREYWEEFVQHIQDNKAGPYVDWKDLLIRWAKLEKRLAAQSR